MSIELRKKGRKQHQVALYLIFFQPYTFHNVWSPGVAWQGATERISYCVTVTLGPVLQVFIYGQKMADGWHLCVTDFLNGSRSVIGRRFIGKLQGPQIVLQVLEIKRYESSVGIKTAECADPHPHSLWLSSAFSGYKKLAGVELVGSKGLFSKSRSRLWSSISMMP